MTWVSLRRLLKSSVGDHRLDVPIKAASVVESANVFFGKRFNDVEHRLVRAVSYQQGILTVACRSPVYAEEIKMLQSELQTELKKLRPPVDLARLKFAFANDMLNPPI